MPETREAVIIEAVRTPIGKRNGSLKDFHPVDMLAEVLKEVVNRSGVDPGLVEDNITGCVSQVGEQSLMLSSTRPGSTPERSAMACSTWARRSTGWVPASDPFRLPIGLRTASTMTASRMVRLLPSSGAMSRSGAARDRPRYLPNGNKCRDPLYGRSARSRNGGSVVRVGGRLGEGVAGAVRTLGAGVRRPGVLVEVEGFVEVPGLPVALGELGQAPVVLDEPEHARDLPPPVVDEPVLRVRGDHQERDPDPQPELVHLRGRDVVVEPAPVVPGAEHRGVGPHVAR